MSDKLDVVTIVICDDVRKEITNKDILIGVYTGDIIVAEFPAWIGLSVWMEIMPRETGIHKASFRLGIAGKQMHEGRMEFNARSLVNPMGASLPNVQYLVETEGEFLVEMLVEGSEPKMLKRKRILKGDVKSAFRPAAPSSLASNS